MRAVSVLVAGAVVLRLGYAGWLELAPDEAYYWTWSRHLAAGYYDHPPGIAAIIRAGTALLGDTERGVRLFPILLGGASTWAAARVAREPLLAASVLCAMPIFALGAILATPDTGLLAAWALGLFAASRNRWPMVGVAAGLAMMCKYTGAALLPLVVLAQPRSLRTREPWIAAGISLLIYLPNLVWNVAHDGISWRFQLFHIAHSWHPIAYIGAQIGLVGPILFSVVAAWWAVGWRGDPTERLCWWLSFPIFGLAVLVGGEANWGAVAYISAAVGVATRVGRWRRAAWVGTAMSAAMSAAVLVHVMHPIFQIPKDPTHRLLGGRILADSVAAWGLPDVRTARYQEAALIHFYSGIVARTLPDEGRRDQYDLQPAAPVTHGLFVRPWRGEAPAEVTRHGYTVGDAHTVTAYAPTPDPLTDIPVARWQVYEVRR